MLAYRNIRLNTKKGICMLKTILFIGLLSFSLMTCNALAMTLNSNTNSAKKCDTRGKVIKKADTTGVETEYTYHPVLNNKISQIIRNGETTKFEYNARGDLIHAIKSNGQDITLTYNPENNIDSMIEINKMERTRRELTFLYNKKNKPTYISMIGIGNITVEYDEAGNIIKVESPEGVKMALQVLMAFQNLLSVTSLADAQELSGQ